MSISESVEEVVSEVKDLRVSSSISVWKIGVPLTLLTYSFLAGFYALVVSSGPVALSAILMFTLGSVLGLYLAYKFFQS